MQNPRAATGRRRATAVAGSLVAALAASALTAMPALAADGVTSVPAGSTPLTTFDGHFSGAANDTIDGKVTRYGTDHTVDLASLGNGTATLTTTITEDEWASDWSAQGNLFGVGFARVIEGETGTRGELLGNQHVGDAIIWAQDNSRYGTGMCANSQFGAQGELLNQGAGYQCGLPYDNASQTAVRHGSTFRYEVTVKGDGTWSSRLVPLDADGDVVTAFQGGTRPLLRWSGQFADGTQAVVPFIRAGLGDPGEAWDYAISDSTLKVTESKSVVIDDLSAIDRSDNSSDGSGHAAFVDGGLRIWTDAAGHRKSAGYIKTDVALEDAGEPALDFETTSGGTPGSQLVVDFDGDGASDGILVGEPSVYGNDWWTPGSTADWVEAAAPAHSGGFGSNNHGTLAQWRDAFPAAKVTKIGYSLGSGVTGDGVLRSISLGTTTYTFPAAPKVQACDATTSALVSTDVNARGWSYTESESGGHHEYVDGGLRVWTVEPQGSLSKSAGYVATNFPLSEVGDPSFDYTATSGAEPGLALTLYVDGKYNGTLTYESGIQGDNPEHKWWGTRAIPGVPAGPASYIKAWGTLDEITAATYGRHDVTVRAVGYSLGSNAIGDATIHSITAGCTTYSFTNQKHATAYESISDAKLATDSNTCGWTAGGAGAVEYVDGGVKLSVPGDSAETWIERDYDGDLASLGDVVDFDASSAQYVGIHVQTAKGEITFEKDASYGGKWWSKSDFGVDGQWDYKSFASLDDYVTANPDLKVTKVRLVYTNDVEASTVISDATFGGVRYPFTNQKRVADTSVTDSLVATDTNTRGWTLGEGASFVDGGVKLSVAGDWAETSITRDYNDTLASLGKNVDFTADPSQYVGIHLQTAKGEITFEKNDSYAGKWWSNSDFGVDGALGYPSFASLDDYITANPGLIVSTISVLYTNPEKSSTVVNDVTFGGKHYTFTTQKHAKDYGSPTTAALATENNTRGWTAGGAGHVTYVAGGVKLSVPGSWAETWIERDYDGDLASLGDDVDFDASPSQYVGLHLETAKGEITFEKDASYDGKWWSKSDFGVDGSYYASFASLDDYITANPDLEVTKVRLLYTNDVAASTVISDATFGGVKHTFASAATSSISTSAPDVRVGTSGRVAVTVNGGTSVPTGAVKVSGAWTSSAALVAGQATLVVPSNLTAGTHEITLTYAGDDFTKPSTTTLTVKVVKYAGLVAAVGGAVQQDDTFKLAVVVMAPGASSTDGHVTVKDGAKVVGQGESANGLATIAVSGLALGTRHLSVAYAGNAQVEAATTTATVVVSAKPVPPVVTFPSYVFAPNAAGSAHRAGKLAVQVIAPGASVTGSVKVTEGSTALGSANLSGGKANVTLVALTAGTHKVTVTFTSTNKLVKGSSATAYVTVAKAASTLSTTWTAKATYGKSSVQAKVKVSAANGLKPTGKVELREGAKVLKRVSLKNGTATVTLPKTYRAGTHRVSVVYVGTSQISGKSSSKTVMVAKATSKVSYTLISKRRVAVTVSVAGIKETGKVQLVLDPKNKGEKTIVKTATVKAGKVKIALPKLSTGTFKVSVKYLGTKDVKSSKSKMRTLKLS